MCKREDSLRELNPGGGYPERRYCDTDTLSIPLSFNCCLSKTAHSVNIAGIPRPKEKYYLDRFS